MVKAKRFKKGSPEAKAFMAKLRRMKGRKTAPKKVAVKKSKSVGSYKKGTTKFVEISEKPYPKKSVVVTRHKRTGKHGTFKSFRKISGIGTNDKKRLTQLASQSKSPLVKKVASVLKSHLEGYDSLHSLLNDVLRHGLQSGMISELVYYSDTIKWFKRYQKEISSMLRDSLSETGYSSPAQLFGKNWEQDDPFANDTHNQNLLAWYSFEETARNIGYSLGYEI
jgi:hypothetical protein